MKRLLIGTALATVAALLMVGCGGRSSLETGRSEESSGTGAGGVGSGSDTGGGNSGVGGSGGLGGNSGVGGSGGLNGSNGVGGSGGLGFGGAGGGGGLGLGGSGGLGFGGAGGQSPLCGFAPIPPVRSYFTQSGQRGFAPRLKASSESGFRVSLLALQYGFPPLSASPLQLDQVTFQPWDAWTNAPLGNSVSLYDDAPLSFATPREKEDGISFMVASETASTFPFWMFIAEAPATESGPGGGQMKTVLPLPPVTQFVTSASASGFHGLGYLDENGGQFKSIAMPVTNASLNFPEVTSCASTPTSSDGVRIGNGILVALTGSQITSASCTGTGPANRLKLWRFDGPNITELTSTSTDPQNPFKRIWLLPQSNSAWMIWQMTVPQDAPLMATRLSSNGGSLIPPFQLAPMGATFNAHGMGTVGDELLFARHQPDPNNALFVIERRDEQGMLLETISMATQPWLPPVASAPIALHGSPDGKHFLMAYSSAVTTNEVAGNSQIFVVRFSYSCTEP